MTIDHDFEAWMLKHWNVPIRSIAYNLWRDNRELLAKVIRLEEELGQWRRDAKQSYEELRK